MDIINARREGRTKIIDQLVGTIRAAFSANLYIFKEKLINECCLKTGIARRTALEYLTIALVAFNTEETKENGCVLIKEITEKGDVLDEKIEDKEILDGQIKKLMGDPE